MKPSSSRILVTLVALAALPACSEKAKQPAEAKAPAEAKQAAAAMPPAAPALPAALVAAVKTIADEKDQLSVQSAFVDFFASPQTHAFFANNYGCVVFPTIGKGGIGVGGAYGAGWVFRQNALTGTAKMTQVTIGVQLGGQAFSQIMFLEDERAYTKFTGGNFELGAQA